MKWSMIKRAAKKFILLVQATRKTEEEAIVNAFMAGVAWHEEKAWVRVSDRLPEIDREVVVLADISNKMGIRPRELQGEPCYQICFAHRVDPNSFVKIEGKEYHPEGYGKGGWNIEGVKYWLDIPHPLEQKNKNIKMI